MKIQNHKPEKNHGEFIHRMWLKEILRYVAEVSADGIPDDLTGIKSISLNDERKTFYVDYYDKNGNVGTFESHYSQIVSGSKDAWHVTSAELKFSDKTDPNTLNALTIVFQDGSTQTIDSYHVLKNLIDAHNDLVSDAIRVDGKTIKKASDGTLSADPNEIVKVDGKTITKADDGTISTTGGTQLNTYDDNGDPIPISSALLDTEFVSNNDFNLIGIKVGEDYYSVPPENLYAVGGFVKDTDTPTNADFDIIGGYINTIGFINGKNINDIIQQCEFMCVIRVNVETDTNKDGIYFRSTPYSIISVAGEGNMLEVVSDMNGKDYSMDYKVTKNSKDMSITCMLPKGTIPAGDYVIRGGFNTGEVR